MGGFREFNEIMAWNATLGDLHGVGAELTAVCSKCTPSRKADLAKMLAAKGPLFTLWNQTTACTRPGCAGRVWFYASVPGAGVWPTKMKDGRPHEVRVLLDAWERAGRPKPPPPRPKLPG